MIDHPIIFSAPMVRALLDGRKVMTRRQAWRPPTLIGPGEDIAERMLAAGWRVGPTDDCDMFLGWSPSPWQLAQPGDRLWVREAWKAHSTFNDLRPRDIPQSKIFYLADPQYEPSNARGRPSIFMPRWASRITLTITVTRVERLNSMTDADAMDEGVVRLGNHYVVPGVEHPNKGFPYLARTTPREMFAALWDTLHGSGQWLGNPEVVAISFEVGKFNIDAGLAQ